MKIEGIGTADLATIVAGLVAQGVKFRAYKTGVDVWAIELTGGF